MPKPLKSFDSTTKVFERLQTQKGFRSRYSDLPSAWEVSESLGSSRNCYQEMLRQEIFNPQFCREYKSISALPKKPYKIIDTPGLKDDFYSNLFEWNKDGLLGVALNKCIYIWDSSSEDVKLVSAPFYSSFAAIKWKNSDSKIALSLKSGSILLFDLETQKVTQKLKGHKTKPGCLSWNQNLLTSGSLDGYILHHDVRSPSCFLTTKGHTKGVCSLDWDPSGRYCASGSTDNSVKIWSLDTKEPLCTLKTNCTGVRTLVWSPYSDRYLCTGSPDRKICVWNTLLEEIVTESTTESQVCCLLFSRNSKELISGHGNPGNEVCVWEFPSLSLKGTLKSHFKKVLYADLSPDETDVVTVSADQSMHFWNLFKKQKSPQSQLGFLKELR